MKQYQYSVIKGTEIGVKQLQLPMAAVVANVALATKRVTDIVAKKIENSNEALLLSLDLEVPSEPQNGILENEDVAIVFHKDNEYLDFPAVYALREDFETGLPHEIISEDDHPVQLCLYEHRFVEDSMKFNPEDFLYHIYNWFEKTARNELHVPDQRLEVYYDARQLLYMGSYKIKPNSTWSISTVSKDGIFTFNKLVPSKSGDKKYSLFVYKFEAQEALVINKLPKCIGDLPQVMSLMNDFVSWACKDDKKRDDSLCAIFCLMPKKRTENGAEEAFEGFLFTTNKTKWHIRRENYRWLQTHDQSDCKALNVGIDTYYCQIPISDVLMRACSGIKETTSNCAILGVGALGSQLLDDIARSSWAKNIHIYDNDVFMPHNVVRHVLEPWATFQSKVNALAYKYNSLNPNLVVPHDVDFMKVVMGDADYNSLANADLIIDSSTSIAVERRIALDFPNVHARRISTFFNNKGDDLVMLVEDKNRTHTLDQLEMDYYRRVLLNDNLAAHFETNNQVRYSNQSCRSKSFVISNANVKMLSSIASLYIQNNLATSDEATVNIWHVNEIGESSRVSTSCSNWISYKRKDGIYTIYVIDPLLEELKRARAEKVSSNPPVETGGVLLGTFDTIHHIIYIIAQIPAPDDSKEWPNGFIRGCEGLEEKVSTASKRCAGQISYIGEWHSHPKGCGPQPSADDNHLYKTLESRLSLVGAPFVMGIIGETENFF
ncbi:MAG: ThiF family adenylyltransferase [Prevotella sp.]|jgi:tRNA A37 threonylcarbamoyladenosine dehydratase|nr:ThiF family adenylyltransferase [Prevotella sp.]